MFVNSRSERLTAETKKLQAAAAEVTKLKGDNDKLQKQRDELKKSCAKLKDDLAHYLQVMRAQRQRLVTLLTVLARPGPEDLLIRKIEGMENEVVFHGLCLETQFADNLAAALAEALGAQGWQVQPPTRQSKEMLVGGGPWEFEVRIRDAANKAPPARQLRHGASQGGRREAGMKFTEREKIVVLLLPLAIVLGGYAWWYDIFQRPKSLAVEQTYQAALTAQPTPSNKLVQQARKKLLDREVEELQKQKADLDGQAAVAAGREVDPRRRIEKEKLLGALLRKTRIGGCGRRSCRRRQPGEVARFGSRSPGAFRPAVDAADCPGPPLATGRHVHRRFGRRG